MVRLDVVLQETDLLVHGFEQGDHLVVFGERIFPNIERSHGRLKDAGCQTLLNGPSNNVFGMLGVWMRHKNQANVHVGWRQFRLFIPSLRF